MAVEIVIPRLGWNMDEGVFAGWLKRDGDLVRAGEPLFRLETEKATEDVEATDDGTLRIPADAPAEGDCVAVGTRIGYLLAPGEAEPPATAAPARVSAPPVEPAAPGALAGRPNHPRSSPLARRLARELGVDWTRLHGSGSTGRIRKVDVLAAVQPRAATIRTTRRVIAARLVAGLREMAPVTLTTTVDATNLVNLREQFKAAGTDVPSLTDFLVKLAARALGDHPDLNARWDDDGIKIQEEIHIGIAVDTEAGLVAPVVRDVPSLGLRALASRTRDLIARARARGLRAEEMRGGTFTVTNLGSLGIETFTPIINPPECAVLGVGRIERRPVMEGDRVVGRERLTLSLTFDHRVVDGAPAARFLQTLGRLIENPGPWLVS